MLRVYVVQFFRSGLFVLSLFAAHSGLAQPVKSTRQRIDSLLQVLAQGREDSNKVNVLNRLSFTMVDYNVDSGMAFGQQALKLAEKLSYAAGMAEAYNGIGTNYFHLNQLSAGMDCFEKALRINTQIGHSLQMAQNLGNIGLLNDMLGNYPKALDFLLRALTIFESINDFKGITIQLGNIYQEMGNPQKAMNTIPWRSPNSENIRIKVEKPCNWGTLPMPLAI